MVRVPLLMGRDNLCEQAPALLCQEKRIGPAIGHTGNEATRLQFVKQLSHIPLRDEQPLGQFTLSYTLSSIESAERIELGRAQIPGTQKLRRGTLMLTTQARDAQPDQH